MTVAAAKTYTAEEYLTLEVESELRHEYRAGEIVEMTGGTPNHNEITANLIFVLKMALRKQLYSIFVTDQRLWIPERDRYTYPDVMVTGRPPELKLERKDTVVNPIVIAETLSQSTKDYDRGEKFVHYRTIETFQEYVLIDQYRPYVEHHVKQAEHQWLLTEYQGLDASFSLVSVSVEIALADVYEGIEFDTSEEVTSLDD
ncbi:MAG: Uma2 family endonuclease [Cyanobacteria bacterium J06642_11]